MPENAEPMEVETSPSMKKEPQELAVITETPEPPPVTTSAHVSPPANPQSVIDEGEATDAAKREETSNDPSV